MIKKIRDWFFSKSIKFRVISAYFASLFVVGVVGYSYYIIVNIKLINKETRKYEERLIADKKATIRSIVNVAMDGVERYYFAYINGEYSKKVAMNKAIGFIKSIRYNSGDSIFSLDYVWLISDNGTVIFDPSRPSLENRSIVDLKDKNGGYIFKKIKSIVETNGSGYVEYCWPKLGQDEKSCYQKISYVAYFYPWKWIIGSGFYLNDIDNAVRVFKSQKIKNVAVTVIYSMLIGIFVTIIASFMFILVFSTVVSYLVKMGRLSKRLLDTEISPKLKFPYENNDEVGVIIKNFNTFVDESYRLLVFKKTIEDDLDVNAVYKRIADLIKDDFGIKEFNIFEINNSKNAMKQISVYGDEKLMCRQDVLVDCGLCRAARTAKEVNSFLEKDMCLSFSGPKTKNYICIPLMVGGSVGTVVQLVFDEQIMTRKLNSKVRKLKMFLKESVSVIEAKRLLSQLKESTMRDPLTGLYNRRFLDEFAPTFVATVKRRNTTAGILMCDIDFFKQVNDVYGHNIGDEVLKGVVRAITRSIRESDLAVRFGGEEFLILLQDADDNTAMDVAERIRKDVESTEITVQGNILRKTLSIGVSIFPKDSKNLWKCIKFSDVAMYKAKESGRNKVVRFEPSMWTEENY